MLRQFLLNLMLAFVWVALTGGLSFVNFGFGFALSFFILYIKEKNTGDVRYFVRVPKIIGFCLFFFYEMIRANLLVAYDLITPRFFMQPGIVKYPLSAKTDFEITMLSNMISLTPGTLIVDVSADKTVIYIHVMYLNDRDQFIRRTKEKLENRLLEILR